MSAASDLLQPGVGDFLISFLDLRDLANTLCVSRSWASSAKKALQKLPAATVNEKSVSFAARYCRRLRSLAVRVASLPVGSERETLEMVERLIRENAAHLTRLEVSIFRGGSVSLACICACSALRSLKWYEALPTEQCAQLAQACPLLEDIDICKGCDAAALLSAGLPLRRFVVRGVKAQEISALLAQRGLEEVHLHLWASEQQLMAQERRALFHGLSQLPRLRVLKVFSDVPDPLGQQQDQQQEQQEQKERPLLFPELRELAFFAPDADVALEAPLLERLEAPRVALPASELISRFPSLVALRASAERFGAAEGDLTRATALLSSTGWRRLEHLELINLPSLSFLIPLSRAGLKSLRFLRVEAGEWTETEKSALAANLPALQQLEISLSGSQRYRMRMAAAEKPVGFFESLIRLLAVFATIFSFFRMARKLE